MCFRPKHEGDERLECRQKEKETRLPFFHSWGLCMTASTAVWECVGFDVVRDELRAKMSELLLSYVSIKGNIHE